MDDARPTQPHRRSAPPGDAADLLAIGRLGAPHGLKGEFRLNLYVEEGDPAIDLIDPALADDAVFVFLAPPQPEKPAAAPATPAPAPRREQVVSLRSGTKGLLIGLACVADRTAAEAFPRCEVMLPREALREVLEEETWLGEDLVGYRVESPTGELIGEVVATREAIAQDLLIVASASKGGRRFPVPFVRELVPVVDEQRRCLVVDLPPGLDEL